MQEEVLCQPSVDKSIPVDLKKLLEHPQAQGQTGGKGQRDGKRPAPTLGCRFGCSSARITPGILEKTLGEPVKDSARGCRLTRGGSFHTIRTVEPRSILRNLRKGNDTGYAR
jgi:hypothetical protein